MRSYNEVYFTISVQSEKKSFLQLKVYKTGIDCPVAQQSSEFPIAASIQAEAG